MYFVDVQNINTDFLDKDSILLWYFVGLVVVYIFRKKILRSKSKASKSAYKNTKLC